MCAKLYAQARFVPTVIIEVLGSKSGMDYAGHGFRQKELKMGRELKRVPMDFDWPRGVIWPGYMGSICSAIHRAVGKTYSGDICELCHLYCKHINKEMDKYKECPKNDRGNGPPAGDGYQLWETTSEGSPQSPVFETLEKLCEWCSKNATTFADATATKEQWMRMLGDDMVYHREGNILFM